MGIMGNRCWRVSLPRIASALSPGKAEATSAFLALAWRRLVAVAGPQIDGDAMSQGRMDYMGGARQLRAEARRQGDVIKYNIAKRQEVTLCLAKEEEESRH